MSRRLDPKEAGGSLPSTVKFDAEGDRTVGKNLEVDGKLKLKSLVSASNPDGDITKELGGGGLPTTIEFDQEGNREAKKNLKIDGKLQFSSLVNNYNKEGNAYLRDRSYYLPAGFKGEYGLYSCTSLAAVSSNGWVDFKYIYLNSQGSSDLREIRMARVMPLHYGKITGTNTLIYSTFYFDAGPLTSASYLANFMKNRYNQIQANGHIGDNIVIGLSYEQGKVMALTQAGTTIDLPDGWTYSENQYGNV